MKRQIILASGSKQRKILMDGLKILFDVIPSDIDEKAVTAQTEKQRAELIALSKAKTVSASHPDAIVISGDTFTFVNEKSYEKPETVEQAEQMLLEQSGQQGICYSGFAYLDPKNNVAFSTTAETTFLFRELSRAEIKKYISENPVLTWSAGFCPAYPEGINMIRHISGSLSGFSHGLPMEFVIPLLEKSGVFNEKD